MKVKIGPYVDWFGPYQLAEKILFFIPKVKDEDGFEENAEIVENLGSRLAESWIADFLQARYDRKKRKVKIHIDKYDTWSMDATLAMIIVPMLKQLKETSHGYPAEFHDCHAIPDDPDFDAGFEEWKKTLDKMIWAFEQLADGDWESQYYSGEVDFQTVPCEDKPGFSELVKGPNDTFKVDRDGIKSHSERIDEGVALFGKYYRSLWD